MTIPNYDPEEEAKLLQQLQEMRERKRLADQYLNDWRDAERIDAELEERKRLASLVIALTIEGIELDRVYFRISEHRDDINNVIRYHPTSKFDYNLSRWGVEVPRWAELETKLKDIPNLKLVKPENFDNDLTQWKEPPYYHVKMDNRGITIKLGTKANIYLLRAIPGEQYDAAKREHRIAFSEAWRLYKLLDNQPHVYYDEDAREFVEKQIHFRAQLDVIAMMTTPKEEHVLNGHKLFDFQGVTVEYGQAIEEAGGHGLIIGHEMGLGKTPCSISILEWLCDTAKAKKCLIICPSNLIPNWERQIKKFTGMRPYHFYGEKVSDYDLAKIVTGTDRYYIISYDIISTVTKFPEEWKVLEDGTKKRIPEHNRFLWIEALNFGRFDACAIDEAHYVKNVGSNRSQAIRELKIPRFYPITGTPLLNRPGELWPLMWLVDKEAAGPYETFMKNYTNDGKNTRNVEELREVLRPLMIRKVKKDVLKELPPIRRIVREHTLSPTARKQYEKVLDGLKYDVTKWDGSADNTQVITAILAKLQAMKQVCSWDKVSYVTDLATELYDQGTDYHKVLIFSQYVNTPPVVYEVQKLLSPECLVVSGNDDINERMKNVDRFQNDPAVHFLSCGLHATREGLDITAAGSVIFTDLDWTPGNHWQAEGRAYGRMSDLHTITSYYIITLDTIEEDIWELLGFKEDIFNTVIEGAEATRDVSVAMELIKRIKERG